MEGGFGALAQVFRRTKFSFGANISSQQQNAWVLTCWNLLRQKLQRLLLVEIISRKQQKMWQDKA